MLGFTAEMDIVTVANLLVVGRQVRRFYKTAVAYIGTRFLNRRHDRLAKLDILTLPFVYEIRCNDRHISVSCACIQHLLRKLRSKRFRGIFLYGIALPLVPQKRNYTAVFV